MRWSRSLALCALALFSCVVVLPFLPVAKEVADLFVLEVTGQSSANGMAQVYLDAGSGYAEANSTSGPWGEPGADAIVRLPLPSGTYRALRFDPLNRDGTVTLARLRVVTKGGRVIREFPLNTLRASDQIDSLRVEGSRLIVQITPRASDPQLDVPLAEPLVLVPSLIEILAGLLARAAGVFTATLAIYLACTRIGWLRDQGGATLAWAQRRPAVALFVVAAVAVVASAYPIVFLGKSYVSPNLGTSLLYETFPTLPGYTEARTTDVRGSDIGAIMWQHVPFSSIQHRALAAGEVPLWNRYSAGGVPLLGQGQSMFGDPLQLLPIAANGAAWAWDLKYLAAKVLCAAGLGLTVFALTRRLGPAAIIAATTPFVGFFIYRLNHPAFFSFCYAPWILYTWLRFVQAESWRGTIFSAAGLMGANWFLLNSGTVKEAYVLLLGLNFSGACMLLATPARGPSRLGRSLLMLWAGGLFALIAAPIWLTFLDTLKASYTSYNAPSAFQIQPALLLGLFDETFYRPLMFAQRTFNPSASFVVLLGVLYFLVTLRSHFASRTILALAISALPAVALVFGVVPPAWIVRWPFFGNIAHIDNCFSCVLIILLSVLAGVGFVRASERLGTSEGRADLVGCALGLAAIVGLWVGFGHSVHRAVFGPGTTFSPLPNDQPLLIARFVWWYLAALLVGCALIALAARRALQAGRATAGTVVLLALGAVLLLWRQGAQADAVGFETYVFRPTARVSFHAPSPAVGFIQAANAQAPARAFGLHDNLFSGWTPLYRIETIFGPDALANPYWRELTGCIPGVKRIWDWRLSLQPADVATAQPFLDALNVRYYADLRPDPKLLGRTLQLGIAADLDVYTSPTAWPRAFFTDRAVSYNTATEFWDLVAHGDRRPFAAVQRNDDVALRATANLGHALGDRAVVPATHYRLTENTLTFELEAPAAGVVVVNQAFWPRYFRATANGQRVPIFRLNHALQGLYVAQPGHYEIEVRCLPSYFPRNMMVSALGLLLLGGTLAVGLRLRPETNGQLAA